VKKKTRRILFYSSIIIFFIASWLATLFALGYKYDFVQNKFLKTGSFGIGVNVGADVYINDELAGSTSFLTKTFSKGRLLPRTYNVRLQNEQYQSWQKLIDVGAGAFTDFPVVVLIPRELKEEIVASSSLANITSVKFDPQNKKALFINKRQTEIISLENKQRELIKSQPLATPLPSLLPGKIDFIKSPDGEKNLWFNEHEIWISWLKNTNHQPYRKAGETELITRFSQRISDVQWYKDSEHLIASVGGILKFIEIDTRGGLNVLDISTISGPFYYDKDTNSIFKFEDKNLAKISLG
jgi:hypothetical protein